LLALKVNASPSLTANTKEDYSLKSDMLNDVFDVVDVEGKLQGDEEVRERGDMAQTMNVATTVTIYQTQHILTRWVRHRLCLHKTTPNLVLPCRKLSHHPLSVLWFISLFLLLFSSSLISQSMSGALTSFTTTAT